MPRLIGLLGLAALAAASPLAAADPGHPTVVELFQSQGCSSCPPANANLIAIAGRPDVLALAFQVTYWDQLGWKDTFASPAFTARQWDYARAGRRDTVATPQMIVNGRGVLDGGNRRELDTFLRNFDRGGSGPAITATPNRVEIGAAPSAGPATVWLVQYDPRLLNIAIRAGENGGRTLPHRNVVRALKPLGSWRGGATSFALPAAGNAAWRSAILVQAGTGGPIVAARKL